MSRSSSAATPIACLGIDLDGLEHYCRIYGLDPAQAGDEVYTRGLPRLLDLCEELGVPATLFAIGVDLLQESRAAALRRAHLRGFEIANHSWSHAYDLTRRTPAEQAQEVERCQAIIRAATGVAPLGFRAPGYTLGSDLLRLLLEQGFRYDASVLPSPPYFLTKAAALGWLRLQGRASASILGDPRLAWAPTEPYLPAEGCFHRPARNRAEAGGPLELPISVLPGLRLPLIGQILFLLRGALPPLLDRLLLRRPPFLQVELHGVDGLSLVEDRLPGGLAVQPDLTRPLSEKLRILRELLMQVGRTHRWLTLAEAAVRRS